MNYCRKVPPPQWTGTRSGPLGRKNGLPKLSHRRASLRNRETSEKVQVGLALSSAIISPTGLCGAGEGFGPPRARREVRARPNRSGHPLLTLTTHAWCASHVASVRICGASAPAHGPLPRRTPRSLPHLHARALPANEHCICTFVHHSAPYSDTHTSAQHHTHCTRAHASP